MFSYETLRGSKNSFKRVRVFRIELEFRSVGVLGKGKTGNTEKNLSEQGPSHIGRGRELLPLRHPGFLELPGL